MQNAKVALFKSEKIRKILHQNEWWFVIVDVVAALTGSVQPEGYILKDVRRHDLELRKDWRQVTALLSVETKGGKQKMNCANTEGMLRIIQAIPSPKVEPFKRWMAKIGYERVQEIENPELAAKRIRALYKLKGYGDDWIEKRMREIAINEERTDEWKNSDAKEDKDYEILTEEISKSMFAITPSE